MTKKHMVVEMGDVLHIIGPRENCNWNGRKGMWEICRIDNSVFWDDPATEAADRENARKICAALNATAP